MKPKKFTLLLLQYWSKRDLEASPLHDLKWALPSSDLLRTMQLSRQESLTWLSDAERAIVEETAIRAFCTIIRKDGGVESPYYVAVDDRRLAVALGRIFFAQVLMYQVASGEMRASRLFLANSENTPPGWLSIDHELVIETRRQAAAYEADLALNTQTTHEWSPVLIVSGRE